MSRRTRSAFAKPALTWTIGLGLGTSSPQTSVVGRQIVQVLTPFLLHLLDQGLAMTTVRRHRDNLWLLGGEIIRCRYDDDELARQDAANAIRQLIERDGAPLMWPRITEAQQDSLEGTCRKLNRFMRESAAADSSVRRNDRSPDTQPDVRTTDAVGNSCQMLRIAADRPQIARKNRNSYAPHFRCQGNL